MANRKKPHRQKEEGEKRGKRELEEEQLDEVAGGVKIQEEQELSRGKKGKKGRIQEIAEEAEEEEPSW